MIITTIIKIDTFIRSKYTGINVCIYAKIQVSTELTIVN